MTQKLLGLVLIILGIAVIAVDVSFTMDFMARGLELHKTCPLPPAICPFIEPPWQGIFIAVAGLALLTLGFYTHRKPLEASRPQLSQKEKDDTATKLEGDDKTVYGLVKAENGMIFQSRLVEKTGFTKVKISRVLDSLEMKGLIERKRRGMANVVVLK